MYSVPAASRAGQTTTRELLPDKSLSVPFQDGELSTLHFRVTAERFFQILVSAGATEVSVSLYDPGRHLKRVIQCRRGDLRLSAIAETTGLHRVELRSCDRQTPGMRDILLSASRVPTPADRNRVNAERAAEEADDLTRTKPQQPQLALTAYQRALRIWRTIADPAEELRTLQGLARVLRDSGDSAKALEYLSQALKLSEGEQRQVARAEILRTIATVHFRSGSAGPTLEYATQALEISRSRSDQPGVAEALIIIGDMHYQFSGQFDKAAGAYMEAYGIFETLKDRRGQAQAMLYLAQVDSDRNDFSQAFDRGKQAQALFGSVGDKLGAARSSALLGHILSCTGNKQEALNLFEEVKSTLAVNPEFEATLMNSIARVHADLGDYSAAIPYSKRALQNYAAMGDRVAEAFVTHATGLYYFASGDLINARAFLERAQRGFETLANARSEAESWLALGLVSQEEGKVQIAIEDMNKALVMSREVRDPRLEASALLAVGQLRYSAGDMEAGLGLYQQALDLYKTTQDKFGETTALYRISLARQRLGDNEGSIRASENALEIIENTWTTLAGSTMRAFYFASAKQHFDVLIDSLSRMKNGERAFELSERARARNLKDRIGETRIAVSENVDRDLAKRVATLRATIEAMSERYSNSLGTDFNRAEQATISDELHRLEAELDQAQGQLANRNPRYAEFDKPQPLTLQQIRQQVIDDDSLLLEYALGEEYSYLWAVTHDGFEMHVLPKRVDIEKRVLRLRELITAPMPLGGETTAGYRNRIAQAEAEYPQAAAELSRILLGPVADRLGSRRLVIVGEGALQYLPFAALPTPQSAATTTPEMLIIKHEIVSLPSASTLAVIRKEASFRATPDRMIAVFADPVFSFTDSRCARAPRCASAQRRPGSAAPASGTGTTAVRGTPAGSDLPRLGSTGREADAILALALPEARFEARGFKATKAEAMNPELGRFRIIHFATHTMLNDSHPDLSSLVLSLIDENGKPQSGHLWLRDMYNMRISAELVVLSACETALGKEIKGEGVMSMVRGFMYSGTPRVLASLWKVDDVATADLMEEFYNQMLMGGKTPAAALREAQIRQLNKKSKQSPYYWAGFQLHGEWK